MEQQQKLLWTILSVAILVLVLLGAGMFFFLPADSTGIAKGGKASAPVEWSKSATPAPASTPTPAPAPKPVVTPAPVPTAAQEQTKVTPAVKEEIKTPVPVQTEKKTPVAVTKPAPAPKPADTSTPAKTEVKKAPAESYWIQVGSFGSIDTAEKIKGQLSAKGYKSSIQTIAANGKTFHRVKLGPYATKDDVNSILPKIKALDGMNGSFMTTK